MTNNGGIHNIFLNSTNKNIGDTNYDFKLYFSNYNIHINDDEEAYIIFKTFQTINTFYNINENSNSFTLIIKNNITLLEIPITYTLDIGNYNCYDFLDAITTLCSGYLTMSYNSKQNTFIYNQNINLVNTTVYIICNNYNYKYFGLSPSIRNSVYNVITSSIINMNNFSIIAIKILGLISNIKQIDNFNNSISSSDIFAIINRQDAGVNSLINYTDLNDCFTLKIENHNIDYINLQFFNEYNQLLIDLSDWLIILKIIVKKKLG